MNASFFIYLFDSCIGVAIVALLLLIFRVQADRAAWKVPLMLFVVITFLLCLLYFGERFYTDNYETKGGWSLGVRTVNLLLGFGQIFVWCWYLRAKAGVTELWIRRGTGIVLISILAVQLVIYIVLMDEHFFIASEGIRSAATGLYILFMILQPGVLIGYMILVQKRVEDKEARIYLNGIGAVLTIDFLWGSFYVIMLFRASPLLEQGLYAGFDLISLTFLLVNVLVAVYVYRCDIRRMMPVSEEQQEEQQLAARQEALEQGGLSRREVEVAQLLLDGKSYDDIAQLLHISKYTVKRHAHNIYQKLEVGNKVELINRFRQS
ncbi:MAG: helix-turn-helix transcriptional regulator [Firmicutes bacterium]|nr:helix-turn-helix transcriptional regulator [Bacillota bacterium]